MAQNRNRNIIIKWIVLCADVFLYVFLVWGFTLAFPESIPGSIVNHSTVAMTLGGLIFLLFSTLLPTIIHKRMVKLADIIKRNFFVVLCTQITFLIVWHMLSAFNNNEIVYNISFSISLFALLIFTRVGERSFLAWYRRNGGNSKAILFVGSDPANVSIFNEIMADPATGYHVLGYYSNDEIEDAPKAFRKLGSRDDLLKIMKGEGQKINVDDIYCSLSHDESHYLRELMKYCDREVIRFFYVPRMLPNIQMSLHPEILGSSVVFTNHSAPLTDPTNKVKKRCFDIVCSAFVLICILPFMPIIALITKIQSPGPLFFKQERTGMNGKNFLCYKFRSMHVNEDADKIQATKDDPRKFPFGNLMRKTNIDELPQFWNVLKGDMSIVGPRPHMTLHTEMYSSLIDKYMVRHFAKPGVTGLAQVTGFRGETTELWQMEGRIKKDIWYIEHWSFWLDIRICFQTAWSIIHPDEHAY